MTILYTEKQKITAFFLWFFLLAANILFFLGFIQQIVLKQHFGNVPTSNTVIVVGLVFTSLVSLYFFSIKLETRITDSEISFRFFPFHRRFINIPFSNILEMQIVQSNPTKFYRVYGMSLLRSKNRFVLLGKYSLRLVLNNGDKIYIGTKKPSEVNNILNKLNF